MSKPLRLALALLLTLIAALLLIAASFLVLAGTEKGTAFAVRQVQQQLGETVSWEQLQGSLLGPLHLRNVRVKQPGLNANISSLSLDWQPQALLEGKLVVTELRADGVRLAQGDTDTEPDTAPFLPGDLQLPIDVALRDIVLNDLQWRATGEPALKIDQIRLDAELNNNEITLHALTLAMPEAAASLVGQVTLGNSMPLSLYAEWQLVLPPEQGAPAQDAGTALAGNAHLEGRIEWSNSIDFDLQYQLQARGLEAIEPQIPATLTATGLLQGAQAGDRLDVTRLTLALAESDLQLRSAAVVSALGEATPLISATLSWQGLQWPLASEPALAISQAGELSLEGTSSEFTVELEADLAGEDIPPGNWRLSGNGDETQLLITALKGQLLGGELRASGPVRWQPYPSWDLHLTGSKLDPSHLDPAVTGNLALALDTRGQLQPGAPLAAAIDLHRLEGHLFDYPMQATATAQLQGEQLILEQLSVTSEGNELLANGQLAADSLGLNWSVNATHPDTFLTGARGDIAASGTLGGSPESPLLVARLTAQKLYLEGLSVESATAAVQAGVDEDTPLELTLLATTASNAGGPLLQSMELQVTGSNRQHRATLKARTETEQLQLQLAGGLDMTAVAWGGKLQTLGVVSENYGNWQLAGPAKLNLGAGQLSLEEACVSERTSPAALCIGGAWQSAGSSRFTGELNELPLQLFLAQVNGSVSADLQGELAADGALQADGTIRLSPGKVTVDVQETVQTLTYDGGDITLQVGPQGLMAVADLGAPEGGSINAELALPALHALPPAENQPLRGRLRAVLPDIAGFAAWVPELAAVAGSMDADLKLGGALQQPVMEGEIALRDGAADVPLVGLKLSEINLSAVSDPGSSGQLSVNGSMLSGEGRLNLSGTLNPVDGTVALRLQGDYFKVYDTPDARVWMSPDLLLGWADDTLKVRGKLLIPEAAITPKLALGPSTVAEAEENTPAAGQIVTPSADVVVINSQLQAPPEVLDTAAPFHIDSQIDLELGDAVKINAVGFISQITGAVSFTNTPAQTDIIPIANGRFALEGGTFRSFGQDLEIQNGQIIFDDVPATEPELNLRAVRWIDNDPQVTAAGVTVSGPLEQPVLELFSRPQLEASEIQSYLLTGRSARSRDSVLSLATYVSPRIYVGYGYNMVEGTSEFNSLFTITPRYGLGANVGEADNNVNVTFTYER